MAFVGKTLYGFAVSSSKYIPGCQGQGIGYGAQGIEMAGDGNAFASFLAMATSDITVSIETAAIKSALTAVGATGAALADAAIYFQNYGADGFPASGSAHDKATIASGLIVPTSLTLREGAPATIGYQAFAMDNGTDPVILWESSQALPTDVPIAEAYTLGPVKLGATLLDCVQSVTIDFGVSVQGTRCNGGGYVQHLRIPAVRPSIRIQTAMPINMSVITADGSGSSATSAIVSARAYDAFGMHVAAATTGHITISLGAWHAMPGDDSVSMGGLWSTDFTLRPAKKAATDLLVINTAAALPS